MGTKKDITIYIGFRPFTGEWVERNETVLNGLKWQEVDGVKIKFVCWPSELSTVKYAIENGYDGLVIPWWRHYLFPEPLRSFKVMFESILADCDTEIFVYINGDIVIGPGVLKWIQNNIRKRTLYSLPRHNWNFSKKLENGDEFYQALKLSVPEEWTGVDLFAFRTEDGFRELLPFPPFILTAGSMDSYLVAKTGSLGWRRVLIPPESYHMLHIEHEYSHPLKLGATSEKAIKWSFNCGVYAAATQNIKTELLSNTSLSCFDGARDFISMYGLPKRKYQNLNDCLSNKTKDNSKRSNNFHIQEKYKFINKVIKENLIKEINVLEILMDDKQIFENSNIGEKNLSILCKSSINSRYGEDLLSKLDDSKIFDLLVINGNINKLVNILTDIKQLIEKGHFLGINLNLILNDNELLDNNLMYIDTFFKVLGFKIIQVIPDYKDIIKNKKELSILFFRDVTEDNYEKKYTYKVTLNNIIKLICLYDFFSLQEFICELVLYYEKIFDNKKFFYWIIDHMTPIWIETPLKVNEYYSNIKYYVGLLIFKIKFNFNNYFFKVKKYKRIAIFGAGDRCSNNINYIKSLFSIDTNCVIVDNDKQKWGNYIEGIPIRSPEFIIEFKPDLVIIMSIYYQEIYRQIKWLTNDKFFFDILFCE